MELDDGDAAYLIESIAHGDGLPILGAGCSVSSLNARREPVKTGLQLARALADRAALTYAGEKLVVVLSAVRGEILSDVQIRALLIQEYKGVTPAKELEELFQYSWRRVYTWNIDDAIENLTKRHVQRFRFYNGMADKAAELEGPEHLHVVHLHGENCEAGSWFYSDRN